MTEGRIERWVRGPHVRLDLRSSVAVAAASSATVKRRAVAAVQSGGARGALVQRLLEVPFSILPVSLLGRLPRLARTDGAGLAVSDDAAIDALTRADMALDGAVRDVVWLIPPPSDGARVSALLLGDRSPIGHLRITDLAPTDRPRPGSSTGTRSGVRWPVVIDTWEHDGVVVELTDAIDIGRSTPTHLDDEDLDALIADLQETLGEGPDGLVGAHGDLTPWNLRTTADGEQVLFDWEHRTFAPDGYDLVRYLLAGGDGPERFARLPAERRRSCGPAIEALLALADQRDADRRVDELSDWKRADIAAERAALNAMLDAARRA